MIIKKGLWKALTWQDIWEAVLICVIDAFSGQSAEILVVHFLLQTLTGGNKSAGKKKKSEK